MSRKLLAASLAASAGVLALVLTSKPKPLYAYNVRDFVRRDIRDEEVRVSGRLVPGSLCRTAECGYRFAVVDVTLDDDGSTTLPVEYDGCVLPDTFRDVPGYDVPVVVQGERCQTCHDFRATQIMAKCSGKYEMPARGSRPHASPAPPPSCAR